MGARIYESMTKVQTATGWTVRVWREEEDFASCFGARNDIVATVRDNDASPESIRAALEGMERGSDISAIEVLDRYGNGGIVYPDWP